MERTMSHRLTTWKTRILELGLFLIFLASFGKFVYSEIAAVLR